MTQQHPAGWYTQQDGSQRFWTGTEWADDQIAPGATQPNQKPPRAWYRKKRVIIPAAGLALLIGIGASQGGRGGAAPAAAPVAASSAPASATPTQPATTPAEPSDSPSPDETASSAEDDSEDLGEDEAEAEDPGYTVSQQQAIDKANQYLDYTAFSKSGLAKQLKFEGFSKADAAFAVEHIDVDWNEQAALKAQNYLDYSAFSKSGLIKQLEFEGFTHKQALHGVAAVGL